MIIVVDNCRCTKKDNFNFNFNFNNLVKYLNDNKYKHSVVKTHS